MKTQKGKDGCPTHYSWGEGVPWDGEEGQCESPLQVMPPGTQQTQYLPSRATQEGFHKHLCCPGLRSYR